MQISEIATKQDIEDLKSWVQFMIDQQMQKIESMPEYINESKAAELLGIKRTTLQNWKYTGKITAYKVADTSITSYKYKDIVALQSEVKRKSNKEIQIEANTYLLNKKLKDKR